MGSTATVQVQRAATLYGDGQDEVTPYDDEAACDDLIEGEYEINGRRALTRYYA